jgi:hypothetical protein
VTGEMPVALHSTCRENGMMRKQSVQKHLFRVFVLSLVIALVGGGIALFYQWHQGTTPGQAASSGSVVGPPSLPASYVDSIFRQLGSPMVGTGKAVEAASRAQNIDDAFALAVWWTETNDGAAGVGLHDLNPGSVRGSVGYPSAYDGYTIYPSYSAAVTYWFSMMKQRYIDRGLTTVYAISHPYVGTSTSNLWAGKVVTLMNRYRAEAPRPTATPKPSPTIPPNVVLRAKQIYQQDKGVVYPHPAATPQAQQQSVQQPVRAASTLSASTERELALFALLFALVLGLGAWFVNRRYARHPQPAVTTQPVGNIWEQLQASQQRPSAFFGQHSLSGLLQNTEDLAASMPHTDNLALNDPVPAVPGPASEALLPLASFMSTQEDFPPPQMPWTLPAFTGQHPHPETPDWISTQATSPLALPARAEEEPATSPLPRRTRLMPSHSDPVMPATSGFSARQPQLVGVGASSGRSNGLLSRYREMQAQGGQEQSF